MQPAENKRDKIMRSPIKEEDKKFTGRVFNKVEFLNTLALVILLSSHGFVSGYV
jgi:hypothetical protein